MVDEGVVGADRLVSGCVCAHRVVVVLERPDLELRVQRPDSLVGVAPHREAEHGHSWDVQGHAVLLRGEQPGVIEALTPGLVGGLDLRLVADPVRDRSHQPDLG